MPKSRIMIQLEPETIEQVDKIRGAVPRAAWVRLLIEDRLRQPLIYDATKSPKTVVYSGNPHYQASVSQQEENRKPGDERSNRSRRAGKGSGGSNPLSRPSPSTVAATESPSLKRGKVPDQAMSVKNRGGIDYATQESSRPIKCVCGGVIFQDGPKAGKCTKCAKPKEAK